MNYRLKRLKRQQIIKMVTFIGLLVLIITALAVIENLLASFVLAVVVSYFISPLISYLEGAGLSRLIAILIVYSFVISLIGVMVWALTPFVSTQMSGLKESLPQYVDGTVKLFGQFAHFLETSSGGLLKIDIGDRLREWLMRFSDQLVVGLPGIISSSASILFLSPILGFFILKDGRQLSRELLKMVPNNIFELTLSLQHQISDQIAQYIRARLLESIIVGLVCLLGFLAMGFPYAVLLSLFAAIANLIPYVGPIFGAAPGIILALINGASGITLVLVFLVYLIAQIIDYFLIIPLLVARIVNLHPVTVVLVVILGAQLMGVLGMFISIPVASALKVTFMSVYNHLTDYS